VSPAAPSSTPGTPGAIEEFVDLVVPELQRRGRYRRDYTGTTQRDHLMQED